MKNFIQKHWISGIGIGFIFTALLYFLKLAVDNGWLPVELRLAVSTILGFVGLYYGVRFIKNGDSYFGQVLAGLGTAILYATIGYSSFTEAVQLSASASLIALIGLSLGVSGVAAREGQRILFALGVLGGLITPFVLTAGINSDLALFLYLLVINIGAIYVAIIKGWRENLYVGFVLMCGLFTSYYFLFNSSSWVRPFTYCTTIFILYMIGFLMSSAKERLRSDSVDLLFGICNGVVYVLWSHNIFKEFELSHIIPFSIVGLLFLVLACLIRYRTDGEAVVSFSAYLALSLVLLGIVGSDLSELYSGNGMNYVIVAAVWISLITSLYFIGRKLKDLQISTFAMLAFLGLVVYWFVNAWSVDWVPIFGIKYIPFLNPGALIWIGLVILGLVFSADLGNRTQNSFQSANEKESLVMALISHALIGGLLTIQIMNLWSAYDMKGLNQDLVLSLCWFVYALVIFVWNRFSGHGLFRIIGGVVIIISSLKVLIWDLSGESSFQKIVFLLILGGVSLVIAKLQSNSNGNSERMSKNRETSDQ